MINLKHLIGRLICLRKGCKTAYFEETHTNYDGDYEYTYAYAECSRCGGWEDCSDQCGQFTIIRKK